MASFEPNAQQFEEEEVESGQILNNDSLNFSVPRRRCWPAPLTLTLFGNFWISNFTLPGILEARRRFVARPTDIILVTYPKSGTTWLKSLLYAIVHRSRHALDDPNHPLLRRNSHDLVPFLEVPFTATAATAAAAAAAPVAETTALDLDTLPSPRVLSTHIPYSLLPPSVIESGCRLVYLCRDPKDNFVSMWHFMQKLMPEGVDLNEALEMYCEGCCPFGPMWKHNSEYWRASREQPEKVLFLKYEEMTEAPEQNTRRLAEFVGCPFTEGEEKQKAAAAKVVELCSFERMKGLEVNKNGNMKVGDTVTIRNNNFFRNGKVGDWSSLLSPEMAQRFDSIIEEKLRGTGLTFQ